MNGESGTRSVALATSVVMTGARWAARKRISLMTCGQASASTQILTGLQAIAKVSFTCLRGYSTRFLTRPGPAPNLRHGERGDAMTCPQCAFANPPGMRFCGQCGGALATRC